MRCLTSLKLTKKLIHQQSAKTRGHLEKTADRVGDVGIGAERGSFDGQRIVYAREHKPLKT